MKRKRERRMESYVKRGIELIQKNSTPEAMKLVCEGMDYYTNRILSSLSPYATQDAGMIVIVLRHLADEIEKDNDGAKEFAEGMSKILKMPALHEKQRFVSPNMK